MKTLTYRIKSENGIYRVVEYVRRTLDGTWLTIEWSGLFTYRHAAEQNGNLPVYMDESPQP